MVYSINLFTFFYFDTILENTFKDYIEKIAFLVKYFN